VLVFAALLLFLVVWSWLGESYTPAHCEHASILLLFIDCLLHIHVNIICLACKSVCHVLCLIITYNYILLGFYISLPCFMFVDYI
jgi:hypothetical protein